MFDMGHCLIAPLVCLLLNAAARADEALLRDGRKLEGPLTFADGRWQFEPAKGSALVAADLHEVRLGSSSSPILSTSLPLRLLLRDGQRLTAGLVEIDGNNVLLQSPSMGKLTAPCAAIVGLRQPPGWAVLHADEFEKAPRGWKLIGSFSHRERGLLLNVAGQSAEFVLPEKLTEGRLSLTFLDEETADARWLVVAGFQTERKLRELYVRVGGDKHYQASIEGLGREENPLARASGKHRLVIQFSPLSLRVTMDDTLIWHTLRSGPGGPLVSIRLACQEVEKGKPARGRILVDDFCLHRAVDEPRRPASEAEQDEVWLLDGGQVFGKCLRGDREALVFEGRFGKRVLPWTLVRGVFFQRQESVVVPPRDRVRLWIDNGFDSQPDFLDGVVQSFNRQSVVVRHTELGDLTLARASVLRVVWPEHDQK